MFAVGGTGLLAQKKFGPVLKNGNYRGGVQRRGWSDFFDGPVAAAAVGLPSPVAMANCQHGWIGHVVGRGVVSVDARSGAVPVPWCKR
jgi:hypothetical protein